MGSEMCIRDRFAGIISRIPSMISTLYSAILTGTMHWAWTLLIVAVSYTHLTLPTMATV